MAYHFSANQYEDAFCGKKLRNYTVPRKYKERPVALDGYSQIVANDRGHLLENVPRSRESPWGTFMGTWDMPLHIPPARPSYTARSKHSVDNLKYFKSSSTLNQAVNGYKPFRYDKRPSKKSLTEKVQTPPPAPEKSPAPLPSGLAQPGSARNSPRKSASPVGRNATPPVATGGSPIPSQRCTPLPVIEDQPRSRPLSKRASPVPSRVESAGSQTRMFNNHIRVSPTPSLKSDALPDMLDTGRPRSGGSVKNCGSPLKEEVETY